MGLNLFEGLRAAGAGFGQLAAYQGQEDKETADQLRTENLLRLKNQLDTTHDVKIEGIKGAQTDKNQAAYLDRLTLMQAEQDNRLDTRLKNSDARQSAALADADKRQQDRSDQAIEMQTRKGMADGIRQATLGRQKAVDDIGKVKARMAAYLKQQAPLAGLDPDNPTSIIDLAKKDPQALSYFQDLRDADNRRRQFDAYLQQNQQGFHQQPGNADPSMFPSATDDGNDGTGLIPPSMSDDELPAREP